MRETADDVMLVAGSGLAAALNIILFAQTLAYGSKKAQLADKKKKQ